MPVPKFDELMNPVLQGLHELGGSGSIAEMEDAVAKALSLTEVEVDEIHRGNVTKLRYRLAWARNYLKQVGLVERSARGVWALTAAGAETKSVAPDQIKRAVHTKWRDSQKSIQSESDVSTEGLELDDDVEQELTWKEELLEVLRAMPPDRFERLCQRLLRESGFIHVEVTGRGGDGGIDGKGVVKIGGLLSFHVIFQAKRYKDTVSSPVVRDFRGAMIGRADKGLIITTGTFTRDARHEAQRDGAPPLDLIDGEELAERLKSMSLGVTTEQILTEKVEVNASWFESI